MPISEVAARRGQWELRCVRTAEHDDLIQGAHLVWTAETTKQT